MKRTPLPGVDLGLYLRAVPLLARNPSIIVIPLLMAVIGVLAGMLFSGGMTPFSAPTMGIASLILFLLQLFGLGAACVIADDAWRHGRASFDRGWTETQRRGGDILFAALGVGLVISLGQYVATILGALIALVLQAAIALFLLWAIPAAAVGGVPGGAALQVSVDRVRANFPSAAIAVIVSLVLVYYVVPLVDSLLVAWLVPYVAGYATLSVSLLYALLSAIAYGYVALVLTKTYTDASFTRRW